MTTKFFEAQASGRIAQTGNTDTSSGASFNLFQTGRPDERVLINVVRVGAEKPGLGDINKRLKGEPLFDTRSGSAVEVDPTA
jgi:hypothetical protein